MLIHLEDIYTLTSPAHHFFRVRGGGPLTATSVIDCEETVEGEHCRHVYEVDRFEPESMVRHTSAKSVTTMPDGKTFHSRVHCHFILSDARVDDAPATEMDFGVAIVLPSRIHKFVARMMGTETVWKPHVCEESLGFARLADRACLTRGAS